MLVTGAGEQGPGAAHSSNSCVRVAVAATRLTPDRPAVPLNTTCAWMGGGVGRSRAVCRRSGAGAWSGHMAGRQAGGKERAAQRECLVPRRPTRPPPAQLSSHPPPCSLSANPKQRALKGLRLQDSCAASSRGPYTAANVSEPRFFSTRSSGFSDCGPLGGGGGTRGEWAGRQRVGHRRASATSVCAVLRRVRGGTPRCCSAACWLHPHAP